MEEVWEVDQQLELLHRVTAELKQRTAVRGAADSNLMGQTECVELLHVPAMREERREVQ
jgi:hypothetical protein